MASEFDLLDVIAKSRREIASAQAQLTPHDNSSDSGSLAQTPSSSVSDQLTTALQQLERAEALIRQDRAAIQRAEDELAEERNRLKTIIDNVPEHIYIKDLQHRFVLSNTAHAIDHKFQSPDDIIGKTDLDLYPEELAQEFRADEARVIQSGNALIAKVAPSSGLNGGFEWSSDTKVPLRNLHGDTIGLVGITRDVTSQVVIEQAVQETVAEIYDLYNNAPCGYHSLNEEGTFIQINEVELKWLGYTKEEVVGKMHFTEILTDEGKETFRRRFPIFKETGFVKDAEFDLVGKDGQIKTVFLNATVVRDDQGKYVMSRSIVHDVTELKRIEMDLRESEEKFRLIIEAAPLPIVVTDRLGYITLVNRQSELLFGYTHDELMGQLVEILVPATVRSSHVGNRNGYHASNRTQAHQVIGRELTARHKNGHEFPVEIELSHIETQDGKLVISFIVDISERKANERQLRFNASLQDNVMDAVIATDMHFKIQSWNGAAERIYGWTAVEVLGRSSGEVFKTQFEPGQTLESYQRELMTKGSWQQEVIQSRKDGTRVHILSSINVFKDENGHPLGVVGVNHDITERKKSEETLQVKIENELEFQIYLKALHEITVELTQIDHVDDFYRRVVELGLERLGFDRLALFLYDKNADVVTGTYGTSLDGLIRDEHHIRFSPGPDDAIRRAAQQTERFCFDEQTEIYDDLKVVGLGWHAAAALWDSKQIIGWLVADNIIFKQPASKAILDTFALYTMTVGSLLVRKQTDAALRESESRYRLLAENISDVIVRLSPVGEILYASPSSLAMLGYRPEEMVGRFGMEFVNADEVNELVHRIAHATDGVASTDTLVFHFLHKAGHRIWIEATGQVITSSETGDVKEFIASLRDISERKRAEEAIKQALAKEKELGELKSRFVSMASHEFRTPLANILAITETVDSYRHKMNEEQIGQRLGNIRGQVGHLSEVINDVLQLARIQAKRIEFNPQPVNLDEMCKEIIAEFDLRTDISQELIYTSHNIPPLINLDKRLIRQVINNLISNAVKYSAENKHVKIDLSCNQETCTLTIADEGIGIPEADLNHMFEPFHRATNVGTISGTGLGLSISQEAIELHNGKLSIESKVGIGTTAKVSIPLHR